MTLGATRAVYEVWRRRRSLWECRFSFAAFGKQKR